MTTNKSEVLTVRVDGRLAGMVLENMNERGLTKNEMMMEMILFYFESLAEPPVFFFDIDEA